MEKDLIVPGHVAIIPDGNRRWARKKNLKPWEGHEKGAQNLEGIVETALNKGVRCLSFWGSSMDNLTKRPLEEKRALLDIYSRYFKKLMESKEIVKNEVKVNVIGRWEEQFPERLKKVIYDVIGKTKHYKKRLLNFMLAYNGDDDMIQAIQSIHDKYGAGAKVTPELIKENLMTKDLPLVDFVIRTGGEPHLSNGFMMWDTANSQLYFYDGNFPDFDEKKFEEAIEDYSRRQRRFGK